MDNVNIKFKYCDLITGREIIYSSEPDVKYFDITFPHVDVCKRYIDDPDETIGEYLNWEIGESNE